jgi:hypothetical protein
MIIDDFYREQHLGMSLRDYFAGQALAAMDSSRFPEDWRTYAKRAYMMADAMLAARSAT